MTAHLRAWGSWVSVHSCTAYSNRDNSGLKETGALQEEHSAHRIQGMLIPQDHQRVCIYP